MSVIGLRSFFDQNTGKIMLAAAGGTGATLVPTEDLVLKLLQIAVAAVTLIYLIVKCWRFILRPTEKQRQGHD